MATVADEPKTGLDPLFDPTWFLTEEQQQLLGRLREICETEIRPRARENDATLTFPRLSLAYYRDGRDSVTFHGDTTARDLPEAIVATVSLGEPRRFLLRPRDGGRVRAFMLGWGDLIVMGGACQRTWRHAVPKVAHAGPRIAVMYRPIWSAIDQ